VDEVSNYHLKLSKDNPFETISGSVNGLLDKVHANMEMIKSSKEAIVEKNEQLNVNEEELRAQLNEIETQKEYINFLANHDPLTNLPNRRQFNEKLKEVIDRNGSGAILLLDLDNFKGINDTLGHVFGDKVLQHISNTLSTLGDSKVFVSRFGGDEFLIFIEGEEDVEQINKFAKHVSHLFDDKFVIDDIVIIIEFSMGLSLFPRDSCDINHWL
jgi:diguanylate cyclase (GGDEF)-like protein